MSTVVDNTVIRPGFELTGKSPGVTYAQFIGEGWTHDVLLQHEYIRPTPMVAADPTEPFGTAPDVAADAVKELERRLKGLANEYQSAMAAGDIKRRANALTNFGFEMEHHKSAVLVRDYMQRFGGAAASAVHPVDWATCVGEPPPREWWIQDWLSPASTGMWGPGGMGKTKILQATGTGLAMMKPYLAAAYRAPLVVVMWLCEDDAAEVWRTQAAINRHFGISMTDLVKAGRLHIIPRMGEDNMLFADARGGATFTPAFELLREQLNDVKANVFIGDNIAHLYGGIENDRHQVTRYVNGVAGLVTERPFGAIHAGHVAKSEGSEFSGSTAWENSIRSRWLLARSLPDEPDAPAVADTVYLARRKANHAGLGYQRFKFDGGLFIPEAMQSAAPGDVRARNDAADAAVLAAFDKLLAMGMYPSDQPNAADYLPKKIAEMQLAMGYPVSQLKETMNRLIREQKLKRAPDAGRYANGDPRPGLVRVIPK